MSPDPHHPHHLAARKSPSSSSSATPPKEETHPHHLLEERKQEARTPPQSARPELVVPRSSPDQHHAKPLVLTSRPDMTFSHMMAATSMGLKNHLLEDLQMRGLQQPGFLSGHPDPLFALHSAAAHDLRQRASFPSHLQL